MTRISAIVLIAAAAAAAAAMAMARAPAPSFAQNGASQRGTASLGTAQSSGGPRNSDHGIGGELGTGHAKPPETPSGDAVINQENALLERKLKNICRGC